MIQRMATPPDLKAPAQSGAMSDHMVRLGNLRALQKQHGWDDSELARQCGRTPQQVYAWAKNRRIGERLARDLEEALGLARYALDDRPATLVNTEEKSPNWGVPVERSSSVQRAPREMPIIRWAHISTMLDAENAPLKAKSPHLSTFAVSSPRAKFVVMPDDSMSPDYAPGDHVLCDPAEAPRAGDVVLVRIPSGEHFLRIFRPRTAYVFEAVAANPNYQTISSETDGALVVAVMVEHRRYRQPG